MNQEVLAKRSGLSASYLSMLERGQRNPNFETIASIATSLEVSLSSLFLIDPAQRDSHYGRRFEHSTHPREELQSIAVSEGLSEADIELLIQVARQATKSAANVVPDNTNDLIEELWSLLLMTGNSDLGWCQLARLELEKLYQQKHTATFARLLLRKNT